MTILIDRHTRVITQGITGRSGRFHTQQGMLYSPCYVGGVTPGKGGEKIFDLPIFDTVLEAKQTIFCDASLIFVPPPFAANAILEAEEAGIAIIVCITEGIPLHDMIYVSQVIRHSRTSRLIGPNCPGIISPGQCKMGIMPNYIHSPGKVGIVSRSGTLTYEAVLQTTKLGLGQSTCIGIGGDPFNGTSFVDILNLFEKDDATQAILMIGEIGGQAEEQAAEWIRKHSTKPIAAFIAGKTAPTKKRMGHAGAVITDSQETAIHKINALEAAGVYIVPTVADMGNTVQQALTTSRHI